MRSAPRGKLVRRVLLLILLSGILLDSEALPRLRRDGSAGQAEETGAPRRHFLGFLGRKGTGDKTEGGETNSTLAFLFRAARQVLRLRFTPGCSSGIPKDCAALLRAAGQCESGTSLPEDVRSALLSGRAGAKELAGFLRLSEAGALTRAVAALHPLLRDRCAADEEGVFAPALASEVVIGCASKLAAQAALLERSAPRGLLAHVDLVALALLLEAAGDVVLVCLFAPSAGLSMSPASSRRAAPLNIFAWGRSLPAFAAQRGSFSAGARVRSVVLRGAQLLVLGLAVCIVGEALGRHGPRGGGEARAALAVSRALGFGAFMATATNLRYQTLALWEARVLPLAPRGLWAPALLAARFANALVGGLLWLQFAPLIRGRVP